MEEQKKVRKHTTSAKVRNRWNSKHYDRVGITIPKGYSAVFKDYCEGIGTTSNAVLSSIIKLEIKKAMEAEQMEA